jgi:hypothetical protein
MIRLLWILTAVTAAISAYGWWFHFNVGPTHGAGRELGIIAGLVSVGTLLLAWRLR